MPVAGAATYKGEEVLTTTVPLYPKSADGAGPRTVTHKNFTASKKLLVILNQVSWRDGWSRLSFGLHACVFFFSSSNDPLSFYRFVPNQMLNMENKILKKNENFLILENPTKYNSPRRPVFLKALCREKTIIIHQLRYWVWQSSLEIRSIFNGVVGRTRWALFGTPKSVIVEMSFLFLNIQPIS